MSSQSKSTKHICKQFTLSESHQEQAAELELQDFEWNSIGYNI